MKIAFRAGAGLPDIVVSRPEHGTLIIGVRAKDGIVVGADSKVMRGGEPQYADKIRVVENVVFATEGFTGIADDFFLLLEDKVARRKGFDSLYEAKLLAEDLVAELQDRYGGRIGDTTIGALVGGLENITDGAAKLYYLHSEGYAEAVTYRCSGSGGPYATTFAKFLHSQTLPIEENARRIAFVIDWVAEQVDTNVGGPPKIAMIRDGSKDVQWLQDGDLQNAKDLAEALRQNLWDRVIAAAK